MHVYLRRASRIFAAPSIAAALLLVLVCGPERSGNTITSDQYNNRVIEVTPAGKIVFQQGKTNVVGNGFNRLNGPYDAKQIGDSPG